MVSKTKSAICSLISLVTLAIATQISSLKFSLDDFYVGIEQAHPSLTWLMIGLSALVLYYFLALPRPVYLLDFSCYKPNDSCKCTKQTLLDKSSGWGAFTEESLTFQKRVLERSGLGEDTYVPEVLLRVPCNPCLSESTREFEVLIFGALDNLFSKIDVKAKDIGILVLNCGLFHPTPSLSAKVVNHYKLRSNIMSYNLGGMGCSASVISIGLAKDLLQVYKNSYALVVSVEAGSSNWYFGNERSMLVSNCVFRIGSAAMLLSNKRSERRRSKYQLLHTVRVHKGADDKAFDCVTLTEDSEGKTGIALAKDLTTVAGDALKANVTALGPLVLPFSEQFRYIATTTAKKLFKNMKLKPYIPDFKSAFEHFCVHAGGRAVLDGVEKNLRLSKWHMEPSRMTLYRFGNTSSTSIWYELAYTEAKGRVKKGDRIWQIAFGSGFKCNSAVWRALRTVNPARAKNPWMDEINSFPVEVAHT